MRLSRFVGMRILGSAVFALTIGIAAVQGQSDQEQGKAIQVREGVTVSAPSPWYVVNRTRNSVEFAVPLRTEKQPLALRRKAVSGESLVTAEARMAVSAEPRRNHADALSRLAQIASEQPERPELVVVAGWPALERRRLGPLPTPGETAQSSSEPATFITTAVAADTLLLRFETVLRPGAEPKLAEAALQIARTVSVKQGKAEDARQELSEVGKRIVLPRPPTSKAAPPNAVSEILGKSKGKTPSPPGASQVQSGYGELEIAVSSDGQHVVVAANSGHSHSDDGGQTFQYDGGTPCIYYYTSRPRGKSFKDRRLVGNFALDKSCLEEARYLHRQKSKL